MKGDAMDVFTDPDEIHRTYVARRAAALLDVEGGFTILNTELRRKGFTLAAYLQDHEMHIISGEVYSECVACMAALYPR